MYIRFSNCMEVTWLLLAILVTCMGITTHPARADQYAASQAAASQARLVERFQSELDAIQREFGFPGATAAYILPDGTVGVAASGMADLEAKMPMTGDTRMLAASIGKTFVAATVLALAGEGRLSLEQKIGTWFEDYSWFSRLPNHHDISLRQLLTHTSGLPDHVYMPEFGEEFSRHLQTPEQAMPPERLIGFILDKPPVSAAGDSWSYSDTGYLLVGLIIEKVTGHRYYDEVKRRFLDPLGLDLTTPSNTLIIPGLAAGYMAEDNLLSLPTRTLREDGKLVWHPGSEWTGGGLVSNPQDLVVWARALFTGKALKTDYLAQLLDPIIRDQDSPGARYGLGVAIHETSEPPGASYGHGGWIPGYCSSMRYLARHGIAIAFQINTDIGIVDHSTTLMRDMESRLSEVVIDGYQGSPDTN